MLQIPNNRGSTDFLSVFQEGSCEAGKYVESFVSSGR